MQERHSFPFLTISFMVMAAIISALAVAVFLLAEQNRPTIIRTTEIIKPEHYYQRIPRKVTNGTFRIHVRWNDTQYGVLLKPHEAYGSAWGIDLSEYGLKEHRYLFTAAHCVMTQDSPDPNVPSTTTARPVDTVSVELIDSKGLHTWVQCKPLLIEKERDCALLECPEELPVVFTLAEDEEIGMPIFVAGCPMGTQPITAMGFLTAKDTFVKTLRCLVWQASVPYYQGNSGGPILDADSCKVVGMLFAGMTGSQREMLQTVAYCIPCSEIRKMLDENLVLKDEQIPNEEKRHPKAEVVEPPKVEGPKIPDPVKK